MTGRNIVVASWASVAIFAIFAVLDAAGVHAIDVTAAVVSLGLFLVSIPIWIYALGVSFTRSVRGDEIIVPSLFLFTKGSAPRPVRMHLMGALAASILIAAATGFANPFGWLVPMLPLGFAGLWGARHGVYPPRRDIAALRGGRR